MSSVDSVTGTPRPMQPGERVRRDGRARSRPASSTSDTGQGSRPGRSAPRTGPGRRSRPARGRSAPGPIASARRTCAAPPHSPACSVIRRPPVASDLEGALVDERVRECLLGPGQVPAGQALVPESRGGLGQDDIGRGIVRAQCRADQTDDRPGPGLAAPAPRRRRRRSRPPATVRRPRGAAVPSGSRRSGRPRRPSSRRARRDPLERLGVLHQGDRQVERSQQLGLAGAGHRGDQGGRHAGHVARRVDPARCAPAPGRSRCAATRRGGGGASALGIASIEPRERARCISVDATISRTTSSAEASGDARPVRTGRRRSPATSHRAPRIDRPCPPSSSPAPAASSAATSSPRCWPPAIASSPSSAHRGGRPSSCWIASRTRTGPTSSCGRGDVTRPGPSGRPRRRRRRRASRRAPARPARRRATCDWSTPRAPAPSSRP